MASRSPTPGCLIGITGLVVFTLITIWTVYTGYTQNKEIDKFTQDQPAALKVNYRDSETVIDLRHRVRQFGKAVNEGNASSFSFTADDLNDLIGHEDLLFDLRKMIAFTQVSDTIEARLALPMQTLFRGGKLRYLNGTVNFEPSVEKGQIMLKIVSLSPDKGEEVPEGFLGYISDNVNLISAYRDNKQLSPIFEKIRSLELKDGSVTVSVSAEESE